jgi:hypothetical protein
MFIEEARDLTKRLFGLWGIRVEQVLRVGHALEDLQNSFDTSLAQLAVSQHGIAEEQIACAAGQDGRREAVKPAADA